MDRGVAAACGVVPVRGQPASFLIDFGAVRRGRHPLLTWLTPVSRALLTRRSYRQNADTRRVGINTRRFQESFETANGSIGAPCFLYDLIHAPLAEEETVGGLGPSPIQALDQKNMPCVVEIRN